MHVRRHPQLSEYNINRWYTPGTGRYTRTDPLFFTLQDINPYGYVRSNPLFGTDPLGLQTYHCTRPLGKPPGPKTPPPIINHQYACIMEVNGTAGWVGDPLRRRLGWVYLRGFDPRRL